MSYSLWKMKKTFPTCLIDLGKSQMVLLLLEKTISSSDKVKKILHSLPKEWDAKVTAITESKDLNTMEFSALIGSLINYEIVLKSRSSKAKSKEKNLAFKAKEVK